MKKALNKEFVHRKKKNNAGKARGILLNNFWLDMFDRIIFVYSSFPQKRKEYGLSYMQYLRTIIFGRENSNKTFLKLFCSLQESFQVGSEIRKQIVVV